MKAEPETVVTAPLPAEKRSFPTQQTARPKPLPWLGKRLLALAIASASAGYAFHIFGTWPLGVVAILTPIIGWAALVLAMQRRFGATCSGAASRLDDESGLAEIAKAEADLAAQMDWRRRFGT